MIQLFTVAGNLEFEVLDCRAVSRCFGVELADLVAESLTGLLGGAGAGFGREFLSPLAFRVEFRPELRVLVLEIALLYCELVDAFLETVELLNVLIGRGLGLDLELVDLMLGHFEFVPKFQMLLVFPEQMPFELLDGLAVGACFSREPLDLHLLADRASVIAELAGGPGEHLRVGREFLLQDAAPKLQGQLVPVVVPHVVDDGHGDGVGGVVGNGEIELECAHDVGRKPHPERVLLVVEAECQVVTCLAEDMDVLPGVLDAVEVAELLPKVEHFVPKGWEGVVLGEDVQVQKAGRHSVEGEIFIVVVYAPLLFHTSVIDFIVVRRFVLKAITLDGIWGIQTEFGDVKSLGIEPVADSLDSIGSRVL
ncbi:hypothetical protein PG999_007799 [Apiospora kogelbergensis]|uniref:Uncharacterized protein n=1 Tax=Apiospora kogelbergensis TaxID=1337665 RepID=A0AAW0QMA1_9PEZI